MPALPRTGCHEPHQRMPARMKDCTNCRWNSRNAIRQRRHGHDRRRRNDRPVDAGLRRAEHRKPDRQRPAADRIGHDQRPQEIVPVIADRDQRKGDVGRTRQRHIDPPQHLQRPRALDPRRVDQFLRNALEGLPQQKDRKGAGEIRQRDRRNGIEQPDRADGAIILHDQHVRHDHQLQQHQRKRDAAALELEPRERIGRQRRQHQLSGQHQAHQQDGVEIIAPERRLAPGPRKILQRPGRRQAERGRIGRRMQRAPERVSQRRQPDQRQQPRRDHLDGMRSPVH